MVPSVVDFILRHRGTCIQLSEQDSRELADYLEPGLTQTRERQAWDCDTCLYDSYEGCQHPENVVHAECVCAGWVGA